MNGWARDFDDLADATTGLLLHGPARDSPLVDLPATLTARDAVLAEVRALVGAIADPPSVAVARELTVHDVTERPAQSLHAALCQLSRVAVGLAGPAPTDRRDPAGPGLTSYEELWQQAARATVGLERYVDALAELPAGTAWKALGELADVAAALPYLDHDLSQAVHAHPLGAGEDLSVPERLLTSTRHSLVRLTAQEVRDRLRHLPERADARQTDGSAIRAARDRPQAQGGPVGGLQTQVELPTPIGAVAAARAYGPQGAGRLTDVEESMVRVVHAVSARSADLSASEIKAVAALIEAGATTAAATLRRVAPAVPGAEQAAAELGALVPIAGLLRRTPVCSVGSQDLRLPSLARDLRQDLERLIAIAGRMPAGARDADLRQLAGPALAFARHVPQLTGELDRSARRAVQARNLAVPGVVDDRRTRHLEWQPHFPGHPEPQILTASGELAGAARATAPAVLRAGDALQRLSSSAPSGAAAADRALTAARRSAGAARDELGAALSQRAANGPVLLAGDLPRHPRQAPPPLISGPQR